MDSRLYWIGFNMVRGVGAVRFRTLLNHFGSLEIAWNAPQEALKEAGLSPKSIQHLQHLREEPNFFKRLSDYLEKHQICYVLWDDPEYPTLLKQIDQPPPVLYYKGDLLPQDEIAVAIVGTRKMTTYGRQVTEEVASFLARNGVCVVSGLARGVDAVAHEVALKEGGRTFAVLGCGLDRIYPPEHSKLAEKIIQQGALISDYAPGTPPDAVNFPPRNRIISGLSLATVVVEAGEESGALITATFAVEQGREVFAVPGNIHASQSKGTNRLIQQGAIPLLSAEEILEDLHLSRVSEKQTAKKVLPADPLEEKILKALEQQPLHIDEISIAIDLPVEQVSAILTFMELKGLVRHLGTMIYASLYDSSLLKKGK
ncbi:DNA-processing protein DprA [Anaerolinea thermophila]|uniref:DNA processing protein n=1 Tax=Anaerolinea thermophila (strain DSM 14523 / JCM 11388 / NBRC 100420 / UNI-1) TaxID=926569 RepID=E8N5B3_ANATU|nr:DNA-processing protein DprA [Anaerolinea thermophila]BAJ63627.1 putative DNA processing protein [Anaerolinea thermophila UNI-1]